MPPSTGAFPPAVLGYDRARVDERVRALELDLEQVRARAQEAEQRLARPGAGALQDLGPQVSRLLQQASDEAERLRAEAARHAERSRAETDELVERTRAQVAQEAQDAAAEREALLADARARAEDLLARTQRHADERAQEAVRAAEDEVAVLTVRLHELRALHEEMVATVGASAQRVLGALPAPVPTQADAARAEDQQAGARGGPQAAREGAAVAAVRRVVGARS